MATIECAKGSLYKRMASSIEDIEFSVRVNNVKIVWSSRRFKEIDISGLFRSDDSWVMIFPRKEIEKTLEMMGHHLQCRIQKTILTLHAILARFLTLLYL